MLRPPLVDRRWHLDLRRLPGHRLARRRRARSLRRHPISRRLPRSSVGRGRERRRGGGAAGQAVHLDPTPPSPVEGGEDAVVDRPATPADRPIEAPLAKCGGAIEGGVKAPSRVELPMNLLHQLAAEEVAAAVPLVTEGGVVEERLNQEHFLPKETTKVLHGVADAPEEAQAAAHLAGGEARPEGPLFLFEVPGDRPEQGVLAVA